MNEKLLPCPFCGSEAELQSQFGHEWWAQCIGCGASHGVIDTTPGDAMSRWNTRASAALNSKKESST